MRGQWSPLSHWLAPPLAADLRLGVDELDDVADGDLTKCSGDNDNREVVRDGRLVCSRWNGDWLGGVAVFDEAGGMVTIVFHPYFRLKQSIVENLI